MEWGKGGESGGEDEGGGGAVGREERMAVRMKGGRWEGRREWR